MKYLKLCDMMGHHENRNNSLTSFTLEKRFHEISAAFKEVHKYINRVIKLAAI